MMLFMTPLLNQLNLFNYGYHYTLLGKESQFQNLCQLVIKMLVQFLHKASFGIH